MKISFNFVNFIAAFIATVFWEAGIQGIAIYLILFSVLNVGYHFYTKNNPR